MTYIKNPLAIIFIAISLFGCKDDNSDLMLESNPSASNDIFAINSYVSDTGVSVEEAEKRLDIMDNSNEIYEKLSNLFGEDIISSVYFNNGEDFHLEVRLSDKTKDYDLTELKLKNGLIVPVAISNGESLNSEGINKYLTSMNPVVLSSMQGVQSIGFRPKDNKMVIDVYEPNINVKTLNQLIDWEKLSPEMGVEVIYTDERKVNTSLYDNKVLAGATLNFPDRCTTGFTGYRNGVKGFLTATHCQKNTLYKGPAIGTFDANPNNAYTDYSTLHEISFIPMPNNQIYGGIYEDKIFFTSDRVKKVSGTRDTFPKVNETYLCHFGVRTGKSCGFVSEVNVSNSSYAPELPYGGGCSSKHSNNPTTQAKPCAASFISLSGPSLACSKGDSGGPVYSTTGKAYGIASTASFSGEAIGQCSKLTFSLIDYAVRDLGFSIQTER